VLPEDEIERPTGSQATPTNSSLVAMLIQDDEDERIAAARRTPTNPAVQLPDQPATPEYVRTSANQTDAQNNTSASNTTATTVSNDTTAANTPGPVDSPVVKPIDTTVRALDIKATSDTSLQTPADQAKPDQPRATLQPVDDPPAAGSSALKAGFRLGSDIPEMKKGDKIKLPIYVDASVPFQSATLGLKFDDNKFAIRSVKFGDVFGSKFVNTDAMPFVNQSGKLYVTLASSQTAVDNPSGIIAYVEVEALADGKPEITFVKDVTNVMTGKGKIFSVNF
jgi:hypothetical protein